MSWLLLLATLASLKAEAADSLIDLTDRTQIRKQGPVLIAHRGGVVTPNAPECSSAAIRLAAEAGYAMVELDIQRSRDRVPVLFHDQTLEEACGVQGSISDFTATDLSKIRYTGTTERIITVDAALALCREVHLGVMLDLKAGRDDKAFLEQIEKMIVDHGLTTATVSISKSPLAQESLRDVMFTPTNGQLTSSRKGEKVDLQGTFWFGLPNRLPTSDISRLQANGALVFPAINTFRYPKEGHRNLARQDIDRLLEAGVDGFQIDSIYADLVTDR